MANNPNVFEMFTEYEKFSEETNFPSDYFREVWKSKEYPELSIEYKSFWLKKDTIHFYFNGEEVFRGYSATCSFKEIADKILELIEKEENK